MAVISSHVRSTAEVCGHARSLLCCLTRVLGGAVHCSRGQYYFSGQFLVLSTDGQVPGALCHTRLGVNRFDEMGTWVMDSLG